MDVAFEKLFLKIPARSPRQHAADIQILTQNMSHHVLGADTLRWRFIMGAAGGVHMMVTREPAMIHQFDPTLQLERFLVRFCCGNFDFPDLNPIFRSARVRHLVLARR
jgi:hypothetical protein